ncbi:MAG TPA: glycine cleavage system protein GcvH [Gemmatimonadetes bacterium]|nr:glycine cleavage system protein GcvH [Gemmatimonadota bacterium]
MRASGEEGIFFVGITDYAQGELGDVVYIELPDTGISFSKMEVFGTIEAVKAVSDLYSPISGEVTEINIGLDDDPSLVNSDPYGDGWMIKLRVDDESDLDALLDADRYEDHIS